MAKGLIQAACNGSGEHAGSAYFFHGEHYVRYDWKKDHASDGYPQNLALWRLPEPFRSGVDAVIDGQESFVGNTYFFKDGSYVRYSWARDAVDRGPSSVASWGLTGDLARFDTVLNGRGRFARYAYFFRGPSYVAFDWVLDRLDPTLRPLAAWKLPGEFAGGVDAAVSGVGPYDTSSYFFKAHRYVRYAWDTDATDQPRDVAGTWWGVPELLMVGDARAQALRWVAAARAALGAYLSGGGSAPGVTGAALATHFRLTADRVAESRLFYARTVLDVYDRVAQALTATPSPFRARTDGEARQDRGTAADGTPYPMYTVFGQHISATRVFTTFGPLCRAAMVLHEPVHYVDQKADTSNDIYEHRPEYSTMTIDQAVHNPSSYACFAQHVFYGSDERYGAARRNE